MLLINSLCDQQMLCSLLMQGMGEECEVQLCRDGPFQGLGTAESVLPKEKRENSWSG